jgi:hypothetical protein
MDTEDYESLNESFKVVQKKNETSSYFTTREMIKDISIRKEDISHDEMVGDTYRAKAIKTSRPAVYDIHSASSSISIASGMNHRKDNYRNEQKIDYRVCPICSEVSIRTCNCENRDSVCKNSHKWYVKNGKIILGYSH